MKAKLQSQVQNERLVLEAAIPLATPLVVYLEPSGYCNLKCGFCPHGVAGSALKKDIMSLELFKKLMDDLSAFPERVKLLRVCGNGDPLMNKALLPMLEHAHERRVVQRVELLTNGALLTPDLVRNLPRFLDRIVFSIEGLNSEDYQRICGTTIDFEKLLDNLNELYAWRNGCVVHIKIHHKAVPTADKEKQFLTLFGDRCDQIFIEKLVPMWPQLDLAYSSNEFRWGDSRVIKRQVCAQIFKGVQVQADGEVVPCCVDWKRVNMLGNIGNEPLIAIWNGAKLRKLQTEHLSGDKGELEPCKDCTMNDYCEVDNIDGHAQECLERLKAEVLQ
ncbi:MAG: radical SAM/SPASM domain-containing protein [Syntrophobacteraceae bacterium]|jgi:radical SAM protein with 4Fe4S-binding SPASM domain